jgi:hypothetical protein
MESRRAAEDGEEFASLQPGWCVGSEEFREEKLAQMKAARSITGRRFIESHGN